MPLAFCQYAFPRASEEDMDDRIKKFFVKAHRGDYQRHLNTVDRSRCTFDDLIQACKQYEAVNITSKGIPGAKPVTQVQPSSGNLDFMMEDAIISAENCQLEQELSSVDIVPTR